MVSINIVKYFLLLDFESLHTSGNATEALISPGNALINNFLEEAGICQAGFFVSQEEDEEVVVFLDGVDLLLQIVERQQLYSMVYLFVFIFQFSQQLDSLPTGFKRESSKYLFITLPIVLDHSPQACLANLHTCKLILEVR
jgi:hypothetical protein